MKNDSTSGLSAEEMERALAQRALQDVNVPDELKDNLA